MDGLLLTAEIMLAVLAAVVVTGLLVTFARRRTIAAGQQLIVCGLRHDPERRWRYGLLRTSSDALDWFSLFGVSLRPRYTWDRYRLDFASAAPLAAGSGVETLVPRGVLVPCEFDGQHFDLAMSPAPYTALRSWLEAAPPGGYHLDIA